MLFLFCLIMGAIGVVGVIGKKFPYYSSPKLGEVATSQRGLLTLTPPTSLPFLTR